MAKEFRLKLIESKKPLALKKDARRVAAVKQVGPTTDPKIVYKNLASTPGWKELVAKTPNLADFKLWLPTATFSVCMKTGTALWLDLWDADHFDGFTDMKKCVTDCRAWFSDKGFDFWGSAQTKTGRINCYFNAPANGNYICTAELQSYGGPAMVECIIDSSSFGFLPINGTVVQPHPCTLGAGGHSFRIRQVSGSFFFIALTVWKV
ncbi:MAG: hypothetical protein JWM21_4964 [Acidobacteria bacterium]|nr:hypothetical protein [Acidobacteriota bacterium]